METTVAIAGAGAVSALGIGVEPLETALRANASGLRPCEKLAGKGYQSIVAGWVPDDVFNQLRSADPAHADARAFLLADAALKQAAAPGGSGVLMFMANAALEKAGWPPKTVIGKKKVLLREQSRQNC